MEGKALTENITRNIISEVLRECKNHQISASSEFIAYYIKLLRLDPNTGTTEDFLTNRVQIQEFIKHIITSLLHHKKTPQIQTLRLQHVIETYVENIGSTIEEFRRNLTVQLFPLLLNITEQNKGNIEQQLYKKISHYAVLASGLGNPNERPVYKETVQVLQSILNDEEIKVFPSLQNYIKKEIVQCLTDIITGIRLYNKQCKKGGEGMPDLPDLLNGALKAIHSKLTQSRDHIKSKTRLLRKCAAKHMNITQKPGGEWFIQLYFPNDVDIEKWEYCKNTITLQEQIAKTTQVLLDSLEDLNNHKDNLEVEFQEIVFKLKQIVIPHLHQSVTEVFPHFLQLASIYKNLQDDALKLKGLQDIFVTQVKQMASLKHESIRFNDEQEPTLPWLQIKEIPLPTITNSDVVYHITNKTKFLMNNLEFGGYCCWILTNTDGLLVPALANAGVVEYKSRFYGFCSILAANSFCLNPLDYIMNTIKLARSNVCLIKLLNLEEMLDETFHIKNLVENKKEPKTQMTDAMIQTETHYDNGYMDYNYFWNIWDQKKRVLKQTNQATSVTQECQTDKTHQRNCTNTQTYKKVDGHTQTKVDNYMNTKKFSLVA